MPIDHFGRKMRQSAVENKAFMTSSLSTYASSLVLSLLPFRVTSNGTVVDFENRKIINVQEGTNENEVITKQYVDKVKLYIDQVYSALTAINLKIKEGDKALSTTVTNLSQKIELSNKKMEVNITKQVKDLTNKITNISVDVTKVQNEVKSIYFNYNKELKEIDQNWKEFLKNNDKITERLKKLELRFQDIETIKVINPIQIQPVTTNSSSDSTTSNTLSISARSAVNVLVLLMLLLLLIQ